MMKLESERRKSKKKQEKINLLAFINLRLGFALTLYQKPLSIYRKLHLLFRLPHSNFRIYKFIHR
jgi:hypothetical protein